MDRFNKYLLVALLLCGLSGSKAFAGGFVSDNPGVVLGSFGCLGFAAVGFSAGAVISKGSTAGVISGTAVGCALGGTVLGSMGAAMAHEAPDQSELTNETPVQESSSQEE